MITPKTFFEILSPQLSQSLERNLPTLEKLKELTVKNVQSGKSVFVFGSGHSGLWALELYHRAGGASFVVPVVADWLLPSAGPPVIRVLERTQGLSPILLKRADARRGEMIWISSQSGINAASVDMAMEAKSMGLHVVAFTSVIHSQSVSSRHSSKKRLFEVADDVVDLGGFVGDASVPIRDDLKAGALSNLTAVFLAQSILVPACAELESLGIPCVYTSVNTPEGEIRNRSIEQTAQVRDRLLR